LAGRSSLKSEVVDMNRCRGYGSGPPISNPGPGEKWLFFAAPTKGKDAVIGDFDSCHSTRLLPNEDLDLDDLEAHFSLAHKRLSLGLDPKAARLKDRYGNFPPKTLFPLLIEDLGALETCKVLDFDQLQSFTNSTPFTLHFSLKGAGQVERLEIDGKDAV